MSMDSGIHQAWNLVDAIAVINLDSCTERMVALREKNGNIIPLEKLYRISAVYGRELPGYGKEPWFTPRTMERASYWGGAAGCVLSHRRAIETAREKGWRNVLIIEDDVEFQNRSEGLALLETALKTLTGKYMRDTAVRFRMGGWFSLLANTSCGRLRGCFPHLPTCCRKVCMTLFWQSCLRNQPFGIGCPVTGLLIRFIAIAWLKWRV